MIVSRKNKSDSDGLVRAVDDDKLGQGGASAEEQREENTQDQWESKTHKTLFTSRLPRILDFCLLETLAGYSVFEMMSE